MSDKPIDLLELEAEEGPEIILPNRRTVRIRLFDGPHYQRYLEVQRTLNDEMAWELLTYALPDATPEEIGILSPVMMRFITRAAARQADIMLDVLRKNGHRPATPPGAPAKPSSPPPPSTRKTKSRTPSPESRKRSGPDKEPPTASGP